MIFDSRVLRSTCGSSVFIPPMWKNDDVCKAPVHPHCCCSSPIPIHASALPCTLFSSPPLQPSTLVQRGLLHRLASHHTTHHAHQHHEEGVPASIGVGGGSRLGLHGTSVAVVTNREDTATMGRWASISSHLVRRMLSFRWHNPHEHQRFVWLPGCEPWPSLPGLRQI